MIRYYETIVIVIVSWIGLKSNKLNMIRYCEMIVIVIVNWIELKSNKIEYGTLLWYDSYCDC